MAVKQFVTGDKTLHNFLMLYLHILQINCNFAYQIFKEYEQVRDSFFDCLYKGV